MWYSGAIGENEFLDSALLQLQMYNKMFRWNQSGAKEFNLTKRPTESEKREFRASLQSLADL